MTYEATRRAYVTLGAALLVSAALPAAQDAPHARAPEFEVASVKANQSGAGQRSLGFQPGGRFVARNMTLRGLVAAAYGAPQPLPLYRVTGGPGWVDADRFDIDAMAAPDPPPQAGWTARNQQALRALLAGRFGLKAHQEQQPLPSYALVVMRDDGRLGARITVSPACDAPAAPPGTPRSPSDPPPCGGFGFTPPDRVTARHLTMDETARFLTLNVVDRPVLNRTNLPGHFNWDLEFAREVAPGRPADPAAAAAPSQAPSIFTALQEQLGLELDPIRSPFDVVVIDAVSRPDPD